MEIRMSKEEFVDLSDGLDDVISLVKKVLLNNLEFNQNLEDFVKQPSGKLTMHAQGNEKDVLVITYQLDELAEYLKKIAE